MISDLFHRLLFPTLVTTVIGTVWIVGWCGAMVAEVEKGYSPAIPVPGHAVQTSAQITAPLTGSQSSSQQQDARSLDQVFLKNDQIIRVR